MILVVNTSFPELDQLAAGLAKSELLSTYVRPYANLQRTWERHLAQMPGLGQAYTRSFGRRRMPQPLVIEHVREAGVMLDLTIAMHARLPSTTFAYKFVRETLIYARTNAVARV